MSIQQPVFFIDAFTTDIFKGNPAAVCPLTSWLPDYLMQSIAAENNLAETAFFIQTEKEYEIRWFTPTVEVDLCGHATLASAQVIFDYYNYTGEEIKFNSKSGILSVTKNREKLCLNFPARVVEPCEPTVELLANFNKAPKEVLTSGSGTYIVVLENEKDIRSFRPNFEELSKVDRCVNITAPGESSDFVSRFFGPNIGLPEDSVTGSAHCGLAIYWSKKLNRSDELHAIQLSQRTGEVFCKAVDDRVYLSGSTATYLQGHINI